MNHSSNISIIILETKSQFARDDPAFLVLLIACLVCTSFGFVWVFGLNFTQTIFFVLYVVFVDCILTGVIVASIMWMFSNKFLRDNDQVN